MRRKQPPAKDGMKTCARCEVVKPVSEFGNSSRGPDRLAIDCKQCRRARDAERRADPAVREKNRANVKAWRDRMTESERREYIRQKNAKVPREKKREQTALYMKRHPEKAAEFTARKRAKRAAAPKVESVNRMKVWERDGGICGICGEVANRDAFHVDHIVPIARGGEHSYANVQVAHPACNLRKGGGR